MLRNSLLLDSEGDPSQPRSKKSRVTWLWAAVSVLTTALIIVIYLLATKSGSRPGPEPPANDQPTYGALPNENVIVLLHFNDLYVIEGTQGHTKGGVPRLAAINKQVRTINPKTLLICAGDLLSPSIASSSFKGEQMVDSLNAAGLELTTIGNHDLDFGPEMLETRVAESNFPWISANLGTTTAEGQDTPFTGITASFSKQFQFTNSSGQTVTSTVCIFGVSYDIRRSLVSSENITYEDHILAANNYSAMLRSEGCSVVVALSHMIYNDDCQMSKAVPELDLIIGGHDHEAGLITNCGKAPIIKGTSDLADMWTTNIILDDAGNMQSFSSMSTSIGEWIPSEANTAKVVSSWVAKLDGTLQVVVGKSLVSLDAVKSHVRSKETNVGNWAADATREVYDYQVDAAFINGGAIRADAVLPAGNITLANLINIFPFGNTVVTFEINGTVLLSYLSKTLSCYNTGCGDFLQVSGFKYVMHVDEQRVATLVNVSFMNGTAINDTTPNFIIATNNYIYATDFSELPLVGMASSSDGVLDSDALVDKIKKADINATVEGRVLQI